MNPERSEALSLASRLLDYPDGSYLRELPVLRKRCEELAKSSLSSPFATQAIAFIDKILATDASERASQYAQIFDFTAAASLYMTWHRYGNDRAQGRALAALNGLYRAAGFEPDNSEMPDYLPRMLEFLAIAPEWAGEALLDGFGAEMVAVLETLEKLEAPHAYFLGEALKPLRADYPALFAPRKGFDPTKRPMAKPEPEPLEPLLPISRK